MERSSSSSDSIDNKPAIVVASPKASPLKRRQTVFGQLTTALAASVSG